MATEASRAWSNVAIPPGEFLEEELEARGMTQQELAVRTGRPPQAINEIIRGKKAITSETALQFERVLGIPAHIWMNLETSYQMTLAKLREHQELTGQAEALKRFPVRQMEKRGWISRHKGAADKVRAVLDFFSVASLEEALAESVTGFRFTGGGAISHEALAVWLRKGELVGKAMHTAPYNQQRFTHALRTIRRLTADEPQDSIPTMQQLCAESGVAVTCVEEFPKSKANGVARWLTPEKALIQLSLRWKRADVFWFSFFHEACHVLHHGRRRVYLHGTGENTPPSEIETEADVFSRDLLIAPEDWARILDQQTPSAAAVVQYAAELGIGPDIIVGRMHHEKIIEPSRMTDLLQRWEWAAHA